MRSGSRTAILLGALLLAGLPREVAGADTEGARRCPATGHWYLLARHGRPHYPWWRARIQAKVLGGYLATVTSETENRWLVDQFLTSGTDGEAFIGGSRSAAGTWTWVTGEAWIYTNWGPGRPAGTWSGNDYLKMTIDGTWEDVRAGVTAPCFLVEWDADPNAVPTPPAPELPDLVVTGVQPSPSSPRPGESIRATVTARNEGGPSGPIEARLCLEGYDGPPLAGRLFPGLGPGELFAATMSGVLPPDLLPGVYRVVVRLSPDSSGDADWADNVGRAPSSFRIEGDPIPLAVGPKLAGHLGPLGRQSFTLNACGHLSAKVVVKLKDGAGLMRFTGPAEDDVLAEVEEGKRLRCSIIGREGRHQLLIASAADRTTRFQVRLRAKSIRIKGELDVGNVPVALEIPGLPGMKLSVKLLGSDGFVPSLDLGTLGEPDRVRRKGTRVKAKGVHLEGEGPWTIGVSGRDDAVGRCTYRVRVR